MTTRDRSPVDQREWRPIVKIQVQMMDVSRNGLKVRTPQFVARGAIVQLLVKQAIVLGEVRYCVPAAAEFNAGIEILDLIPKLSH